MSRILIIEDEASIRRVLVKILTEENAQYKVFEAEDGLIGTEMIKKEDFDLIERHYYIHGSTLFVMNLIEVAIFNKNWPYVFDLFNPHKLNIIENKGLISNFAAKLANLTLIF